MGKKILVVEDDKAMADLMVSALKSWGFEVRVAEDAIGASLLGGREHPDLILLDFSLPAGDGGQVYYRLRTSFETAGVPIIFISSHSLAQLEAKMPYLKSQMHFFQKPVDLKALRAHIDKLLGDAPKRAGA